LAGGDPCDGDPPRWRVPGLTPPATVRDRNEGVWGRNVVWSLADDRAATLLLYLWSRLQ
jgi:hypothetical protein